MEKKDELQLNGKGSRKLFTESAANTPIYRAKMKNHLKHHAISEVKGDGEVRIHRKTH